MPSLTLDEFSATLPADMHSEAELIALWKESQADAPSPRPAQHRLRLIERQLEALRWLEMQPDHEGFTGCDRLRFG